MRTETIVSKIYGHARILATSGNRMMPQLNESELASHLDILLEKEIKIRTAETLLYELSQLRKECQVKYDTLLDEYRELNKKHQRFLQSVEGKRFMQQKLKKEREAAKG